MKLTDDIKDKLERLSVLSIEFLDRQWSHGALAGNPGEMERLRTIVWENLWRGRIDPHDLDWNPDPPAPELIAKGLLYIHELLTRGIWEDFKKELKYWKATSGPTIAPPGFEGLEQYGFISKDVNLKIKFPGEFMPVRCSVEGGTIHFFRSTVDAIPAFLDLLQGLPLDHLHFCGNVECDRFIVQTTGHARKFCSAKCQSVQFQRIKRDTDREAFNRYHRENYHQRKELEKRQALKKMKGGKAQGTNT
ncbi:MAG: hypothetical protein CVU61_14525 [Deltaproteobacteria bacterium HGW-Deltaproteobacteria-19]|jgi:endogenous inhibitor of DNA gyrase (YacG/DUF329 family)|nr:MAG: hypothetical protein CVU61_14525 [Deltaproteobacteria bacterium HGW-Deltaproteobacteria-19]